MSQFAVLDIGLVRSSDRIRAINEAQVQSLMQSIKDVGLLNPITAFEREVIQNGNKVSGYGIIAGSHRFEACKRLGHTEIAATIVTLSELERQIAECDENLCGSVLTPSDRAKFTARRKEAYEALHPETVRGFAGASAKHGSASDKLSFADDQAAKTGMDKRTVQRDAARGQQICGEALDILHGTKADTGIVLDRLKALTPAQQVIAAQDEVNRRGEAPKGAVKAPRVADAPESDEAALERQVAALMAAWNKAGPDARKEFLGRIDRPLMDQAGWK